VLKAGSTLSTTGSLARTVTYPGTKVGGSSLGGAIGLACTGARAKAAVAPTAPNTATAHDRLTAAMPLRSEPERPTASQVAVSGTEFRRREPPASSHHSQIDAQKEQRKPYEPCTEHARTSDGQPAAIARMRSLHIRFGIRRDDAPSGGEATLGEDPTPRGWNRDGHCGDVARARGRDADAIGVRVGAGVVGRRCVDERAIRGEAHRAVRRRRLLDRLPRHSRNEVVRTNTRRMHGQRCVQRGGVSGVLQAGMALATPGGTIVGVRWGGGLCGMAGGSSSRQYRKLSVPMKPGAGV